MVTALDDVIHAYGAAWLEDDPAKRLAFLETCWCENGTYIDPNSVVEGREALADHISGFHAQMPGARIVLTSGVAKHHAHIYFSWQLVTPDGHIAIDGVDFGTMSEDGMIREIVGFFGPPPAL